MHRIPVGVLGASGYAGRELCTLISEHPGLDLAYATANAQRGERMAVPGGSVTFIATEDAPISKAELVFSSLPHGASAEWVARVRAAGWTDEALYFAITVCALFNFYNRWIDATGVHALSDEAHRQGGKRSAQFGYVRR